MAIGRPRKNSMPKVLKGLPRKATMLLVDTASDEQIGSHSVPFPGNNQKEVYLEAVRYGGLDTGTLGYPVYTYHEDGTVTIESRELERKVVVVIQNEHDEEIAYRPNPSSQPGQTHPQKESHVKEALAQFEREKKAQRNAQRQRNLKAKHDAVLTFVERLSRQRRARYELRKGELKTQELNAREKLRAKGKADMEALKAKREPLQQERDRQNQLREERRRKRWNAKSTATALLDVARTDLRTLDGLLIQTEAMVAVSNASTLSAAVRALQAAIKSMQSAQKRLRTALNVSERQQSAELQRLDQRMERLARERDRKAQLLTKRLARRQARAQEAAAKAAAEPPLLAGDEDYSDLV